jgi:uncharacterized protein with von Willebrand factor type A (vWA) domain
MEQTLTSFIRTLRSAGVRVSSAEAIDASRTIAVLGYQDRSTLKEGLSSVLAKSEEEKATHDRLFELFFTRRTGAPPPVEAKSPQSADEDGSDSETEASDGESESGQTGTPQGGKPGQPGGQGGGKPDSQAEVDPADAFMELAQSGDADRIALALEKAAAKVNVDDIRFQTQTAYLTRKLLEQLGVEAAEARLMKAFEARTPEGDADAAAIMQARLDLQTAARDFVKERFELFGRSASENFMDEVVTNRAIGELGLHEMARMKVLVARLAKRLAAKHARRRKVKDRGQLDVRRTLRANAGRDGVPFDVVWQMKKKDRPRIVAICDVSGSVSKYVRFLLLFLYALQEKVTDLEVFAFSGALKPVDHIFRQLDFEPAMNKIVFDIGGSGTDYGQSLQDFRNNHWNSIDRHTTVLVLGDGRSNYGNPRLDIFQELVDSSKRLVWLCPEPPGQWGTGDSCMMKYRPFCTRLSHTATAADLETAIDEILLAYS